MMGWQLITAISFVWLWVSVGAAGNHDWNNFLVYFGIFITNTGFALQAYFK